MNYADFYRNSIDDPQAFWASEAKLIDWKEPYSQVLDYSKPPFAKWFVGGRTNLCHNAVDRWEGRQGNQPALIAISTETGSDKIYSIGELQREVMCAAAMMLALGVGRG